MSDAYRIVYRGGTGEIVEKKSRFIATVIPISSEEEALSFIEQKKKEYWDASHNCSAYTLGMRHETARCSDDGEPQKTAGRPMLDVLLSEDIHNVCVVVTRYFGGTLLGTGGLVRAYQAAAKAGLDACVVTDKIYGIPVTIVTDYNSIGKLQYIIAQMELFTQETLYTDIVTVTVLTTPDTCDAFIKKVTEATSGKAELTKQDPVWFCMVDNSPVFFSE
ncbi:MAG: YigZ family protein [Lachnospiraceae bacterium]|nr:YigZ family protein [Lachnospiraceae bacterium]